MLRLDYAIRGVDDWLCFMSDTAGAWFYLHTECDPAWIGIRRGWPSRFDELGVAQAAADMLAAGARPATVDAELLVETERLFGEDGLAIHRFDYCLRGIGEDCTAYLTNNDGDWGCMATNDDSGWRDLSPRSRDVGAAQVALDMLSRGVLPTRLHPYWTQRAEELFGLGAPGT